MVCYRVNTSYVCVLTWKDHDKEWEFNWKATKENNNLHWDSGLGWRHGPFGLESCLEILCGTTKWREQQTPQEPCRPISIFRNETIQYLRRHSANQRMRIITQMNTNNTLSN